MSSAIVVALRNSRCSIDGLSVQSRPGIYAYFLRNTSVLSPLVTGSDLIYLGIASSLARREFENHLDSTATGFSTLRRSLGAILKDELRLEAIPRSTGLSESNVRNFKFLPGGEARLTAWMLAHLEIGVCNVENPEAIERELIEELRPLLNLKGWDNPDGPAIRELRRRCADEARASRAGIQA